MDTVAFDLEDSVTPNKKAEARNQLRDFLAGPRAEGIGEQAVRINSVDSGLALADLTEVVSLNLTCQVTFFLRLYNEQLLLASANLWTVSVVRLFSSATKL